MEKKSKTLKFFIVLIIILIIALILIMYIIRRNNISYEDATNDIDECIMKVDNVTIQQLNNPSQFYTVSTCIQKYLIYASVEEFEDITQEDKEAAEKISKSAMYNMLSKSYIAENNITEENVLNYVHSTNFPLKFYPTSMNYIDGDKVQVYSVYGYLENSNKGTYVQDVYLIVSLDTVNMTFSIYIPDANSISNINDIKLENNEYAIEKNDYNIFEYNKINDEELAEKYLENYRNFAVHYPEKAFNLLDEEYRNAKFGTLEAYKEYVKNDIKQIITTTLDKYDITYNNNYTQYTCIDTNGNYYIFRETATMQYTLLLDTYTIDIPEFTEKYNTADEMTKVGMNIEKIKEALNAKDYKYIYSKLPDSFKNNYFNTLEAFVEYMENTFYDKNTITYSEFSNEGKNYMFKIEVKDSNNATSTPITKTIIMQLKEGTDFVFSFNV